MITGASRGFGAALARRLAVDKTRVVLIARTESALRAVAEEVRARGGEALVHPMDLADRVACDAALARLRDEVGIPDALVNNAGSGAFLATDETTREQAEGMMAVPYFAAFGVVRAFLPAMIERGSGHVLNVTSAVAFRAIAGAAAYGAACFAVRGFTEALRAELRGTGIDVTLFVAGTSSTPGYAHYPNVEERTPRLLRIVPELTPDRVATAMARALATRPRAAVVPWQLRALLALDETLPTLSERIVLATGWRR